MQPAYRADDEGVGLTSASKAELERGDLERYGQTLERRPSLDEDPWEEAQRLGKRAFLRKTIINGTLISLWYVLFVDGGAAVHVH